MNEEYLTASVQYNDWQGTIALDNDHKDLHDYFRDKINNETILGFDVNIHNVDNTVGISIYTGSVSIDQKTGKRTDQKHIEVKKYKTELTIQDFFRLFKRINIKSFVDLKDTKLIIIDEVNI